MAAKKRYPTVTRRLLEADELHDLARLNLGRWLCAVGLELAVIVAVFTVCVTVKEWWIWIPAVFVIGTRQHALSILGHEGAHQLIAQSRSINDSIGNWLALYPLLITVQGYRSSHLKHHWFLETPDDPSKVTVEMHPADWEFPVTRARLAGMLLRDLSGFSQASSTTLLTYLWQIPNRVPHMVAIACVQVVLFAALTIASGSYWAYPVLWLLPLFTVLVACYRVRAVAEHTSFGDSDMRYKRESIDSLLNTRTTLMCPVVSAIFCPYNVSLHIEHHMYPSVPAFNLPALHDRISKHPEYIQHAHTTRGYRGLLRELVHHEPNPAGQALR